MNGLTRVDYPDGNYVSYSYDNACRLTKVTTPFGTTAYEYDLLDRLTRVVDRNGYATVYEYDANGNRTAVHYANGFTTTYEYDLLNRLICEKTVDSEDNVVVQYIYTLGAAGERKFVTELDRTVEYTYDSLYRLTSETITEGEKVTVYTYAYDNVSNRILKNENGEETVYTYNALNQLVSENDIVYEYDLNGNTVRIISPSKSALYVYNAENRLVRATVQSGNNVSVEEYKYDYAGNRIAKSSEGEYTKYLLDVNGELTYVLAEISYDGTEKCFYTRGDELISQERDGKKSYYVYDGHGSVRALADENGKVTDKYVYDAFGNLISSVGSTKNDFLFCGEQFDPVTGLYYLRARYMNPSVGRFITMDSYEGSIDDPVSLHKYLYANANPVSNSDPSGYVTVNQVKQNVKIISVAIIIVSPTLYSATIEYKHNQQVMQQGMQIVKALRVLEPIITGGSIFSSIYGDQIVALSHELICGIENSVEVCNRLRDEAIAEFVQVVGKSLTKIIRKIDQDRTHKYWEVDFYRLPISKKMNPVIGKGITKARAIERLRQGKSVITMYWYDAENIAYTAGNGARPMHHPLYTVKGNDRIGQFGHYHVGTHINEAHSMYIIGA